jgi:hypothetical protein
MRTPEIQDPNPDTLEGNVALVHDISEWFMHVQDVTPKFRKLRIAAISRLRLEGKTKPQIAEMCGISEHRVNEILKDAKASGLIERGA